MRTKKWFNTALLVGLLSLSGGVAYAAPPSGTGAMKPQASDQAFLDRALGVNQLELQLGQLASQRATTAEVKAMGQTMVQKHTALGQQLAALSRQAGGSGIAKLSSEQRAIYDHVASQSGAAFDSMFKEVVDAGHVKELAMYRDEVRRASSPELHELAQHRVTTLSESVARADSQKSQQKQEW